MRVSDRNGDELDLLAVDLERLGLADGHVAHLHLDLESAEHARLDCSLTHAHAHLSAGIPACQPARSDASAVTGQLGERAVWVPDLHVDLVAAHRDDLDDAVGADPEVIVAELPHALGRELELRLRLLQEQVVVSQSVPLRQSHRRPLLVIGWH